MKPQRIGILGGTFDPVHYGHIIPTQYAFNHLGLDVLILVPSADPVHRPYHTPAPAADRLAMCRLAAGPLPRFTVSDVETSRPEPSYTVLTLRHFTREFGPGARLSLLIGDDNLPTLHTWYRFREILDLCTLVPMPRPRRSDQDLGPLREALGPDTVDHILARRVPGPLVPISATEIRHRVAAGQSVRHLVPGPVAEYIAAHGLYRAAGP